MLLIERALYEIAIEHCRSRYPKEACGLFASAAHDGPVAEVYPMTNVEDSPIGYAMDPNEQLRVEKQMRQRGQRLRGIFHSHTATDAYPSSVDVRLAISPDISYVLVSLKDRDRPVLRSYRIDGAAIMEEPVRIEEPIRQARQR